MTAVYNGDNSDWDDFVASTRSPGGINSLAIGQALKNGTRVSMPGMFSIIDVTESMSGRYQPAPMWQRDICDTCWINDGAVLGVEACYCNERESSWG